MSDGAKCDSGNIQEIFSIDNKIAVCDPVYPVYVDTNVMAGRTGTYDFVKETWSDVIYMPCTQENGFVPELPEAAPDIIYLCFPNNPTGSTITKSGLQAWVDYANRTGAVIIYDAAYEAYISEKDVPHSIYECEGAPLYFVPCRLAHRSWSGTSPAFRSLGTTVKHRHTPVKPAFFEQLRNSIAQVLAPSHS